MSSIIRAIVKWLLGLFASQESTIIAQSKEVEILEAQREVAEQPLPDHHELMRRLRDKAREQ